MMEWNKQNSLDASKSEQNALGQAVKEINSTKPTVAKKQTAGNEQSVLKAWQDFIAKNNLSITKDGKRFLKVEAWNWIFASKKLNVIIDEVRSLNGTETNDNGDPEESTIFVAKALLVDAEGNLVSAAYGACKLGESDYSSDFYSAMSMAQTRAVGKLGRTQFGHLAVMGGYQACPAEELTK